jgi:FKBP-type peptidyl-prolyl cis-trans isomerase FklB
MKHYLTTLLGLGLLGTLLPAAAQPPGAKPVAAPSTDYSKMFKDEKERNGYAIGMNLGLTMPQNLKRSEIDFDTNALINGFMAGVANDTNKLNEGQVRELIGILQRDMRARSAEKQKQAEEKRKVDLEKNKQASDAFLASKKTEAGVIPLPSGLMYKVIKDGTGDSPKASDSVTVEYKGMLIDGTEFDSSAKTGKPATFRVSGVIKGWTEALELMKPGAKWVLYIPADLAYGDRGSPPKIGPAAALVFDVELISVQPGPTAAATPTSAPLTSDIIKVPSAEELKKGAKIETIKAEDIEKERQKEATNSAK